MFFSVTPEEIRVPLVPLHQRRKRARARHDAVDGHNDVLRLVFGNEATALPVLLDVLVKEIEVPSQQDHQAEHYRSSHYYRALSASPYQIGIR